MVGVFLRFLRNRIVTFVQTAPRRFINRCTQSVGAGIQRLSFVKRWMEASKDSYRRKERKMTQLELGLSLRDEGAKIALANAGEDWHTTAVAFALEYFNAAGWEGALFEDARQYATDCGLSAPPSPNAWGAVALSMSTKKLIIKTGILLPSKKVSSHARSQPVWRLNNKMLMSIEPKLNERNT